jgi:phosphoribosylamine--glycine ligase
MGSYKDKGDVLPFLSKADRQRELEVVEKIFGRWKSKAKDASGLRGMPLYVAFMHTGKGLKILENNSRPGDPEIMNVLPILKDDFVDVCFRILEGNLTRIELEKSATVATYKVPPSYGGYAEAFPNLVRIGEVGKPVDLSGAYELSGKYGDNIRVYPASMEQRDSETYALKSRAVAVVGIGDSLEAARRISLEGIKAVRGGALWNRTDIALEQNVQKSVEHMAKLRESL